jgi:hypothetical protein
VGGARKGQLAEPELLHRSKALIETAVDHGLLFVADEDGSVNGIAHAHGFQLLIRSLGLGFDET